MAPNVTVLQHRLASINGFFIDCLISDNHTFDSEVTDFPVESGSTISDNIRNKPLVVTMDCLISNTPIGQLVALRDKDSEPADTAYGILQAIRDGRAPVTIFTSLRTYLNMALQNLSIPRESGRGDELRFTATFKQIETVTNKRDTRVAIVGAKNGGASTVSAPGLGGTKFVYIYTLNNTWYDSVLHEWRYQVKRIPFVKGGAASQPIKQGPTTAGPGQHILVGGRPIRIPQTQWDRLPQTQRNNNSLSVILDKLGPPGFMLDGHNSRYIVLLSPAMYIFDGASPRGSTGFGDADPNAVGRD